MHHTWRPMCANIKLHQVCVLAATVILDVSMSRFVFYFPQRSMLKYALWSAVVVSLLTRKRIRKVNFIKSLCDNDEGQNRYWTDDQSKSSCDWIHWVNRFTAGRTICSAWFFGVLEKKIFFELRGTPLLSYCSVEIGFFSFCFHQSDAYLFLPATSRTVDEP